MCESRSRGRRGDRAGAHRRLGAARARRRRAPGARLRRRPGHPGHRPHRRRPGAAAEPAGRSPRRSATPSPPPTSWSSPCRCPRWRRVLDELAAAGYTGLVTDVTSVKGPVRELVDQRLRRGAQSAGRVRRRAPDGRPGDVRLRRRRRRPVRRLRLGAVPGAGAPRSTTGSSWPTWSPAWAPGSCRPPPRSTTGRWPPSPTYRTCSPPRSPPRRADPLAATLAAGSFRDGTRVAASRPELTAAMCGGNAAAVRGRAGRRARRPGAARAALDGRRPDRRAAPWLRRATRARPAWPPRPARRTACRPRTPARARPAGGWVTAVSADGRSDRGAARSDRRRPPSERAPRRQNPVGAPRRESP